MQIISSEFTVGAKQKCGRRWTSEIHYGDDNKHYTADYLSYDLDRQAIMAAHAMEIADTVNERDAKRAERDAADAEIAVVLQAAVKDGKLSADTVDKASIDVKIDLTAEIAIDVVKP